MPPLELSAVSLLLSSKRVPPVPTQPTLFQTNVVDAVMNVPADTTLAVTNVSSTRELVFLVSHNDELFKRETTLRLSALPALKLVSFLDLPPSHCHNSQVSNASRPTVISNLVEVASTHFPVNQPDPIAHPSPTLLQLLALRVNVSSNHVSRDSS